MTRYSIIPRSRKYVKRYGFLLFTINLSNKYRKKLSDPTTKTELNAAKAASRKAVNKTTEATGELIGKKIAEKIVKTKPVPDRNLRNVEQIVLSTEKRQEILNKLRSWSTFKKQKL